MVEIAHQVQHAEGQHHVVGALPQARRVGVGHRKAQLRHRLGHQLALGNGDHAGRDVGRQQAPGEGRQAQRGGAGGADQREQPLGQGGAALDRGHGDQQQHDRQNHQGEVR
ncbi:hypothetical protein D3C71_1724010 [compost metagenome]